MAFCRQCGKEVKAGAKFCAACGTPSSKPASSPVAPSRQAIAPQTSEIPNLNGGASRPNLAPVAIGVGLLLVFVTAGTYFLKSSTQPVQTVSESTPAEQTPTAAAESNDTEESGVSNPTSPAIEEAIPTSKPETPTPTTAPTRTPTSSNSNWEGERFSETRTRYLSQTDVQSWSYAKVRYALNEIYARHGYRFKSAPIRQQFQKFGWYHPVQGRDQSEIENNLGSIEKANMLLLAQRRNEMQNLGLSHGE